MQKTIQIAHGSGGRLSRDLIEREIVPRFGAGALKELPDAATLQLDFDRIAYSTDSFVVQPIFFPGGDIGELAVYGTINDLAVTGAQPLWLSIGLILEEGLPLDTLRRVLDSVQAAAQRCRVQIVTGDTKVVHRRQCDQIYINTSGIGKALPGFNLGPDRLEAGDCVLVSGTVGDHGMAVLSAREDLKIAAGPLSDSGPVHELVQSVQDFAPAIKIMRDPTRGGLASVLNELVTEQSVGVTLSEQDLPLAGNVQAVAELLGMDLLHVACEGRVVAVCSKSAANDILSAWRSFPEGSGATLIGQVTSEAGRVILETVMGGHRLVTLPEGELLPRIC